MKFLNTIFDLVIFSFFLLFSGGIVVKASESKAVNEQLCDDIPGVIADLDKILGVNATSDLKNVYCGLRNGQNETMESNLFLSIVKAAIDTKPAYTFLGTCLEDVMVAMQEQQVEAKKGVKMNSKTLKCKDNQSQVYVMTDLKNNTHSVNNPWLLYICKSATCKSDNLNGVLSAIYLDYFAAGGSEFWNDGKWMVGKTYTPTVECAFDQLYAPMRNTELYCSGESAPVCKKKRLVEVKLGDDAPFEIAICDDGDCLASVPQMYLADNVDGYLGSNPFCLPNEPTWPQEFTDIVIKYPVKEFNLNDYCSVAAKNGRAGRCKVSSTKVSSTMLVDVSSLFALVFLLLPAVL